MKASGSGDEIAGEKQAAMILKEQKLEMLYIILVSGTDKATL